MKLLMIAVVLFVGLLAVAATNAAGRSADREAPPTVTPTPAPLPEVETVTRYPVPLDNELQDYITAQCEEAGIRPALVLAMIGRESGYDPTAMGDDGQSYGLMQIRQDVHRDRCIEMGAKNLLDPETNIRVGVSILRELLAEGKGTIWALTAYNWGQAKADEFAAAGHICDYAQDVLDREVWLELDAWPEVK